MDKGIFITLEGPEGSGKSTQLSLLAEELERRDIAYITTREPGGTPIANALRAILLDNATLNLGARAELLMLQAARADHVEKVIRPAIERGLIVLCDRFSDSSIAYQGAGRGVDREFIEGLNFFSTAGLLPDLTILVDIDPAIGLSRAGRQGALELDRVESAGLDFHQRVREGFLSLVDKEPDRVCLFDGAKDKTELAREILILVLERSGRGKNLEAQ